MPSLHASLPGGVAKTERDVVVNPAIYTIESQPITLAHSEKACNVFIGWTGSNGDVPEKEVVIPKGSIGARTYYANFQYSGREETSINSDLTDDKIWTVKNELHILTAKDAAIIRIYTLAGVLFDTRVAPVITGIDPQPHAELVITLPQGLYVVTLNDSPGQKIIIN